MVLLVCSTPLPDSSWHHFHQDLSYNMEMSLGQRPKEHYEGWQHIDGDGTGERHGFFGSSRRWLFRHTWRNVMVWRWVVFNWLVGIIRRRPVSNISHMCPLETWTFFGVIIFIINSTTRARIRIFIIRGIVAWRVPATATPFIFRVTIIILFVTTT